MDWSKRRASSGLVSQSFEDDWISRNWAKVNAESVGIQLNIYTTRQIRRMKEKKNKTFSNIVVFLAAVDNQVSL